jgi:hypothetical protein
LFRTSTNTFFKNLKLSDQNFDFYKLLISEKFLFFLLQKTTPTKIMGAF